MFNYLLDKETVNHLCWRFLLFIVCYWGVQTAARGQCTDPSNITVLDCNQVKVSLPYTLTFNGSEGGLVDQAGLGTGFTMVDPPSARIAADDPVSNMTVSGYESSRLSVSENTLIFNAAKGIAYVEPGTSTDTNSQINTLGVGFDASQSFEITATITDQFSDDTNNSEQAGIWFGLDEANFVKLVVNNNNQVEIRREIDDVSAGNATDGVSATVANLKTSLVKLTLRIDVTAQTMTGYYSVNGGTDVEVASLELPSSYINGATVGGESMSFAGLFASKRREVAGTIVEYAFDDFQLAAIEAPTCPPISVLDCSEIIKPLPFSLTFDGTEGGLLDGDMEGVGFTMVDPPSARISEDGTISNEDVPGYEPSRLNVEGGFLNIDAAKGIAYLKPSGDGNTSTETNSQINTLGVGFDASQNFEIKTTITNQFFDGSNNSEQVGIWFGLDEGNFVKLVAGNNDAIELRSEVGDATQNADAVSIGVANIETFDVALRLEVDVTGGTMTGFYSLDGEAEVSVGSLPLPLAYINGAVVDGQNVSFAGVFASKRREAAGTSVVYEIADFSIESTVEPPVGFTVNVNFSDEAFTPPSGYEKDFGEAYGNRGNGYTYGWISTEDGTPISLVGQGRERNFDIDPLLKTLIHMDHPSTPPSGFWEIEVPNGIYQVTVGVGEASAGNDPEVHRVNAEGVNIINNFEPSGANGSLTRFSSGSGIVQVTDGKLTLDYLGGGENTKLTHVQIAPSNGTLRPAVVSIQDGTNNVIPDGATNVSVEINLSTSALYLPNGSLDNNTVDASTVTLTRLSDQTLVPANVNSTGGGDAITLVPLSNLDPNTSYRLDITDGVEDLTGVAMIPYALTFTTGNASTGEETNLSEVNFTKVDLSITGQHSSLEIGPDGKLYASTINGEIKCFEIQSDGTLANQVTYSPFGGPNNKIIVGLEFDPSATPDNLLVWISYEDTFTFSGAPDWDGNIGRLKLDPASNQVLENVHVIDNLPRSSRDHLSNSLEFGADGKLYMVQGSNSAMGRGDGAWANREERLLSAAVLSLDVNNLPTSLPLDVKTDEGGTYNPYALNVPLTIFGTGVRNAYDLLWHSNGQLYVPTNGSAAGGNTPTNIETDPLYIAPHPSAPINTDPDVPAITSVNPTQNDWLFRVVQGGYYGHPNPRRGEYVMNRGDIDVNNSGYNGIAPASNYRGDAFNFELNKSPNGVIEYRSNAYGGLMKGLIMVVRYSQQDDIIILQPGGANQDIINDIDGTSIGLDGFNDPLDLIEDVRTGNLYVSEYGGGGKITLLKPDVQATDEGIFALDQNELVMEQIIANGATTQTVTITNDGNSTISNMQVNLVGNTGNAFALDLNGTLTSLTAGQSTTFDVTFDPAALGGFQAQVNITGDNAYESISLPLKGLGKTGEGGSNEPSLQHILTTFFGGTAPDVGDDNPNTNIIHSQEAQYTSDLLGEEVVGQLFEKAGNGNVTLELLAVYGPTGSSPVVSFGWYGENNSASKTTLFSVDNSPTTNGQRLLPEINSGGSLSFDPSTSKFGFFSIWPAFSNREVYSEDVLNTFTGAIPHHVRVYKVPGELNSYIIATEEHISGFDFQDIVVIARNIKPADAISEPPVAGGIKVNFQNPAANPPTEWLKDFGQAYGSKGDYAYGWVVPGTNTPLDLSVGGSNPGNGRDRSGGTAIGEALLEETLMHMQYDDVNGGTATNGTSAEGAWEFEVPNGVYQVTISAGDTDDENQIGTHHVINAEGVEIINSITVNSDAGTTIIAEQGTATVTVTDGRLTLDAIGGFNTKIKTITIVPVGQPLVTMELSGSELGENRFGGDVTVTLSATPQGEATSATVDQYQINDGPLQNYTGPFVVSDIGSYTIKAVATDNLDRTSNFVATPFVIINPTGAIVSLENMTKVPGTSIGFPADDFYVFHRNAVGSTSATEWHDDNTMRIHNDGTGVMQLVDIQLQSGSNFTILSILDEGDANVTLPVEIPVGGHVDVAFEISSAPGGKGILQEQVVIVTNADNDPALEATLSASYMAGVEGNNEIDVQQVMNVFGFQTSLNGQPRPSSTYPSEASVNDGSQGDLILSPTFVQADPSQPVSYLRLAAFHGSGGAPANVGNITSNHGGEWHQSLLPRATNSSNVISGGSSATLSGPFNISIAGYTTEGTGLGGDNPLLGVRVYKVVNRMGEVMPNHYIVVQDYIGSGCGAGSANCDWNDNVLYVMNIKPAEEPSQIATLDDQNVIAETPFSIPTSQAFDIGYPGNKLKFAANIFGTTDPLPVWLAINATTGEITGTPPANAPSSIEIAVTATDDNGIDIMTSFTLNVTGQTEVEFVFTPSQLDFVVNEDNPANQDAELSVNLEGQSPFVQLSAQDAPSWLILPDPALGTLSFGIDATGLTAGTYQTVVTASDAGSNVDDGQLIITLDVQAPLNPISFEVTTTETSCISDTGTATITALTSVGDNIEISWSHNASLSTATASNLAEGDYSVTVTDTDLEISRTVAFTITKSLADCPYIVRINAGGPAYTNTDGEMFMDGTSSNSVFEMSGAFYTMINDVDIENATDDTIYLTETSGRDQGGQFFYNFLNMNEGEYLIRFHFAEIYFSTGGININNASPLVGSRVFNVNIEGLPVLVNFDVNEETQSPAPQAVVREFMTTVTDGTLNLDFYLGSEGTNNAQVCAIEVIQVTSGGEETTLNVEVGTLSNMASISVDMKLYEENATGSSSPLYERSVIADQVGQQPNGLIFSLNDIPTGNYVMALKAAHTLTELQNINLQNGSNYVDAGALRFGNADNDEDIGISDFSILSGTFDTTDPRADFNEDGAVDIKDFSILSSNFGQEGDVFGEQLNNTRLAAAPAIPVQNGAINLKMNGTLKAGELVTMQVQVMTATEGVDAASVALNFDADLLEVMELKGTDLLPVALKVTYSNENGTLQYTSGTLDDAVSGTFDLVTVVFKVKENATQAAVQIADGKWTDLMYAGYSVLGDTSGGAFAGALGKFEMYPNPSSDVVYLSLPSSVKESFSVLITDTAGKQVFLSSDTSILTEGISKSAIGSNGFFMVTVEVDGIHYRKKLLLK
ncbi:malectin domain-containing carbohydrate-binding protein [Limibacter armeniacum]|uniref:malectin domain-containing carbohydrate-binding protein n=1 Tax=Limibacter armeniacum TaxID=466084 RepID=UPI002FE58839